MTRDKDDVCGAQQTERGVELEPQGVALGCLKCDTAFVVTRSEVFPKRRAALKQTPQPRPNGATLSRIEAQLNVGEE